MNRSLTGKFLIIIGLLISLNPFLIIFAGGPIFIIGSIIYWKTKKTIKSKIIWTLFPIIIWYPLMIGFFWVNESIGKTFAQKKDFIIQENFKGTIKVVESECGVSPIIKNGRLQFEIPLNGIYLFNGELKSGYVNERTLLKKKNGGLIELENKHRKTKSENKDTIGIERIVGVNHGGIGSFGDDQSKYIYKHIETNKIYDDHKQWQMIMKQNGVLDSLRKSCKEKSVRMDEGE